MKLPWLAGLILLTGCASAGDDAGALIGRVRFIDPSGRPGGDASLFSVPEGVRIVANFPGVPEGDHGFHIHETGSCTTPSFDSAGPHFNPTNREHGRLNPNGPHVGDLPNVDRGRITVNMIVQGLQLSGPTSIFDADGSALVLHAAPDDLRTDPSGNSGARIRCGVIEQP